MRFRSSFPCWSPLSYADPVNAMVYSAHPLRKSVLGTEAIASIP